MMPAKAARAWAFGKLPRCKQELPAEILSGAWVFPLECIRQIDARHAARQVALMQHPPCGPLPFEVWLHRLGQHDNPILVTLAGANDNLIAVAKDVFHA